MGVFRGRGGGKGGSCPPPSRFLGANAPPQTFKGEIKIKNKKSLD